MTKVLATPVDIHFFSRRRERHTRGMDVRRSALVITQFYPPEPCAAANRVAALVAALVDEGFDVHVVTAVPSFPSGTMASGDRVAFARTTTDGAIRLTRVRTYASPVLCGRNRIANWVSVALAATAYVATMRCRHDAIVVTLPPITLALPAVLARLRGRGRFVVDVRDVFPDVAVRMGYWRRDGIAARLVGAIARGLYRAADTVSCVTETARDEIVARGAAPERVVLAPNGFDPPTATAATPYAKPNGTFVAAFVGNMGLATGLDAIVDAAALLRDRPEVRFVLAGDGADRARLAARVRDEALENVEFLGVVPRADANALLADADVALVPLHPGLVDSLPTKLFDALVLGCPVVCCAYGEARAFVERSGGGLAVAPGDGRALARAILTLRDDPTLRASFVAAGRAYVLGRYDRARIMHRLGSRLSRDVACDARRATALA